MTLGTINRDGSLARSSQMDSRSLRGSPAECGARSKTPPGTPKKAGKLVGVRVLMLDDSVTLFQVQVNLIIIPQPRIPAAAPASCLHSTLSPSHLTTLRSPSPASPSQSLSQSDKTHTTHSDYEV